MTTERKPSITELIEALELHLSPHTDPDHCEPCPYNPLPSPAGEGGPRAVDEVCLPHTTCQYRLMRDCLDMLKKVVKQEEECFWVKDFIEYTLTSDIQEAYNDVCAPFAFMLGAAFERYKQMWES